MRDEELQRLIDNAELGGTVTIPPGTYLINTPVMIKLTYSLVGDETISITSQEE